MIRHSIRALLVGLCTLTAAAQTAPVLAAAPARSHPAADPVARALRPQTLADLNTSMKGEAFAHASYTFFAAQADREKLPGVARLYRSTARTELAEHFKEEAALARLAGTNAANLRSAIHGESYEHLIMYRRFAKQATQDGDKKAAALFTEVAQDEGRHRAAFLAALAVITTGKGRIPAPPKVNAVAVPAGMPQVSAVRTRANLNIAMHGEALAHAKYALFADRARMSGNAALERLLRGTAEVELREHFAGEAVLAGLVRNTRQNLERTIAGERYETNAMYPGFAMRAMAVGDLAAARLFRHNAVDEAKHALAFRQALDRLR